ncbi:hypothetical protein Agub_g2457 [Astrephomene gubernaculifera]|uniref:Protein-serine/threonine kinase n=1 Tax=Astrephomene gubernaculifera TaxID=47775 RepID=A0AAD3HI42_9CHLO|nr:hypothetical protein Agub_g2457 [Astrephomene gubernaculifera]
MRRSAQRVVDGIGSAVTPVLSLCGWQAGCGRQLHAAAAAHSTYGFSLNTLRAESFYDSTVEKYAAMDVEVLSLRDMLSFGRNAWDHPDRIIQSGRYVQRELPKRLARRLLDLQLLPYIVVTNPHIKRVYNQYYVSFETMRRIPPIRTLEDNQEWCHILRQHLDEHAPMLDSLAAGLRECKSKELVGPCLQLDAFFDTMLRSRISRRVLAEQHLHIGNRRPAYIGIVCTDLDVNDSIEFAVQKTKQVCMETYGTAPDVIVSGDPKVTIPYIPAHLDYMLYELLKNAMRAVVESSRAAQQQQQLYDATNGTSSSSPSPSPSPSSLTKLPPIHVRVCDGSGGTLTIRISDQGGGIPPEIMDKVFSYGFTTIGQTDPEGPESSSSSSTSTSSSSSTSTSTSTSTATSASADSSRDGVEGLGHGTRARGNGGGAGAAAAAGRQSSGAGNGLQGLMSGGAAGGAAGGGSRYRMAGLGFGLPLSRVYARYFGGDLRLQTIPGYGVDAYLTLRRLEEHEWREEVEEPGMLPMKTPY